MLGNPDTVEGRLFASLCVVLLNGLGIGVRYWMFDVQGSIFARIFCCRCVMRCFDSLLRTAMA